jgi:hypothetical protein
VYRSASGPGQADAKTPIKVSAEELVKEFKKNSRRRTEYKGDAEITGKVLRPGRWLSVSPTSRCGGNDFAGVKCYTEEKEPGEVRGGTDRRVVGRWPDLPSSPSCRAAPSRRSTKAPPSA